MITIHKNKKCQKPYFEVCFRYMIGDAEGNDEQTVNFYSEKELEKVVPDIKIFQKVKPLSNHRWDSSIYFNEYTEEYPGEKIGLTEEEYKRFYGIIKNGWESDSSLGDCIRTESDLGYYAFEDVSIYYYDENNVRYNVTVE